MSETMREVCDTKAFQEIARRVVYGANDSTSMCGVNCQRLGLVDQVPERDMTLRWLRFV